MRILGVVDSMISPWLTLALVVSSFQTRASAARMNDDSDDPVVDTEYGKVQGFRYSVPELGGVSGSAFLGIPFAEPPVGRRRFRRPEPLQRPWTGIRYATRLPNSCYQVRHRRRLYKGDSDVISMPAGFRRRHLVGKTLVNVFHYDIAEIRFVGELVIIQAFS